MRCNFALILENPSIFIELAHRYYHSHQAAYLLGSNSLPHITLCQFMVRDNALLEILKKEFQRLSNQHHFFSLLKLQAKIGTKSFEQYQWIELTVKNTPALKKLHNEACAILERYAIACENPSKQYYQPHVTLAAIRKEDSLTFPVCPDNIFHQPISCYTTLGFSDETWQFIKIENR